MTRRTAIVAALLLPCLLAVPGVGAEDDTKSERRELLFPAFPGNTLRGWHTIGGAKWKFYGDTLIADADSGMGFVVTDKTYGDFVLELEFKVPDGGNSGVFFRATEDERSGRMIGYQAEIDSSKRGYSGGVYDAKRRGWIAPVSDPAKRKLFRSGLWNHMRVEAIGDHIRVVLNGTVVTDIRDSVDLEGHIALQHHGERGKSYRFRNVRLWKIGKHRWKPLFDGKTLDGWTALPGGTWSVQHGAIVGLSAESEKRHGMLLSDDEFADFTVRVVYKAVRGNSGLYFRAEEVGSNVAVKGFQAEIDPARDAGGLYETGGRAWVVKPKPKDVKKYFKPGDWNTMTVAAYGKDVTVHVNGHKTAELRDDPGRTTGRFGLQLHGGQDMHVEFKSIDLLTNNP